LKKILFALLLAPLFFTACKKSEDGGPEYNITGIKDVNFTASGGNVLTLSVTQTSGTAEEMAIVITGLPAGVTADIQPSSGIPPFSSVVTFFQSGSPATGTYPIKISLAGKASMANVKTYDLNVVVSALNGFVFDGMSYTRSSIMHATNNFPPYVSATMLISSFDHGSATVQASISEPWPSADGTYSYHIGGSATNAMHLIYSNNATSATYDTQNLTDTTKMATLKIAGGKFALTVNEATLENFAGTVSKTLMVNASE
jgi:hypothetical protein